MSPLRIAITDKISFWNGNIRKCLFLERENCKSSFPGRQRWSGSPWSPWYSGTSGKQDYYRYYLQPQVHSTDNFWLLKGTNHWSDTIINLLRRHLERKGNSSYCRDRFRTIIKCRYIMWLKWLQKTYVSFTSFFQGRSGETVSIIQVCTQRLVTCLVEPCNCYSFNIYCSLSLNVFRCNLRRIKRNSKPPSPADEAARAKAKSAIFLSLIFIYFMYLLIIVFFFWWWGWGGGGGGGGWGLNFPSILSKIVVTSVS